MKKYLNLFCCVSYLFINVKASENNLARGFGDHINWYSLEDAVIKAKTTHLPIMVIIHKTWCGACKALKPKFSASKEIAELSNNFLMVNLEDNEEPKDKTYAPDGGYIPRILFLNSEGEVQQDFYNRNGNSKYKYFYPTEESIADIMKTVSAEFLTETIKHTDEL